MTKTCIVSALLLAMIFTCSVVHGQRTPMAPIPTFAYDELVRNQAFNRGKLVRLNAVWTYGFEWTYLCTLDCKKLERAWVEIADEDLLCEGTGRELKKLGKKFDNRGRVTVRGKLVDGSRYGHMGAYGLKFVITCVEKYEKIY